MKEKKEKIKYYSTENIDKTHAHYRMIYGERSNGKTYAVLSLIVENYIKNHKQGALIRRHQEDFKGKRGQQMFANHVANGLVKKLTKGKWDDITYRSSQWFLSKWDDVLNKRVLDSVPLCYGFSLGQMEHDKSTGYPNITITLFDEFISRSSYLTDEFVLYMNVLSTIIRDRKDVINYMCGNSINMYSPYFIEMGITNIKKQKKGTIDIYHYGKSDLIVAVEYSDSPSKKGKESDVYFAFNNPKLQTITSGEWELAFYPHLPKEYTKEQIIFTYFIVWDNETLQCEIIDDEDGAFTYIHRKTSPIRHKDDVVFSVEFSENPYHFRTLTRPNTKLERNILDFFLKGKVFYQTNEVGEVVRNYLQWSESASFIVN